MHRRVRATRPSGSTVATLREDVVDPTTARSSARRATPIDEKLAQEDRRRCRRLKSVDVVPFVTDEIALPPGRRGGALHHRPGERPPERGRHVRRRADLGRGTASGSCQEPPERVDFMDVSPKQTVSVAGALIPFLEHDDANRALMGSNMQRQAVPLLQPEAPLVGTGMEVRTARDSGQVVLSQADGVVESVDGASRSWSATPMASGTSHRAAEVHALQPGHLHQPAADRGARPARRARASRWPIARPPTQGELALGQNVLVAFMCWEGGNFEDAILLSEKLVRDDKFTSIHIEKHEVEARDTKLGPEEITRDIPNVGEDSLRDLDENGIIRIGAEVKAGDILVGKITPKGETELTAEERLLRAIFGEKAREVKDTSLRVPHGERGKVVDVRVFERDAGRRASGGRQQAGPGLHRPEAEDLRGRQDGRAPRQQGRGLAHPAVEDMPFLPDGRPVEIILNPIGVPSRMNVGQILETHLGWAADALGVKFATPVFDGATEDDIRSQLQQAGLPGDGQDRACATAAPASSSTRRSRSATSTC